MIAAMWPRAPLAVGRTDGWGMDDTSVVIVAVVALLLCALLIGSIVPQHGGRVASWRILGRTPAGFEPLAPTPNVRGILHTTGMTLRRTRHDSLTGLDIVGYQSSDVLYGALPPFGVTALPVALPGIQA